MGWLRFLRRQKWDQERAREIASYLEHEIADNEARGMSASDARLAANRKLGNQIQIREDIYKMNSVTFVETFWQDIRYALRVLRKSPGSTLVALLSLALGIGATTAMFSVVYGVLISPYPYAKSNRIWAPAIIDTQNPNVPFSFHHVRDYLAIRKLPVFADAMATLPEVRLLSGDRTPESFRAISVTSNAFRFLGVPPVIGRTIQPTDIRPNGDAEPVIVLTYKAWSRLFNSSPDALGKKLVLNDEPFTVIGVMPPRFGWWTDDGGWLVLPENPADKRSVAAIFRLIPGTSSGVAEQQLQTLHLQLAHAHPEDYPKKGFTTKLQNYMDITAASGEMKSSLGLLFGAVGFLLLIACANVANLQLARAAGRAHEISVRMSIGAARFRLLRQLLTESVVLSLAGGAAGMGLAIGLTRAVVALMPANYVPNEARISVNGYVLAFSAITAVLTGILFGLFPAIRSSRPDLVDALKDAGRTSGTSSGGKTREGLVVAEIALCVILLMGASLTIRGFEKLLDVNPGFQTDRVLMMGVPTPPKRYVSYADRIRFTERVQQELAAIPGVESVAVGNGGLPFGGGRTTFSIAGQQKDDSRQLSLNLISSGYARTLGIPIKAGRDLSSQEIEHAEPVALINETAARLWVAGRQPIGSRVHIDMIEKTDLPVPPSRTSEVMVVGMIADTRNDGLRSPTAPAIYLPYTLVAPPGRTVAIRTHGPPMQILSAVRERVQAIDREVPLGRPITLNDVMGFETVVPRFDMALFGFFGFVGLALAAVGIYSMLSYTVARRTQEIGIRMAMGASRADVLKLMLRMAGRLTLVGAIVGMAGSFALETLLRSEVFLVPGTDPAAIAGAIALLALATSAACLAPAWRAAQMNPMSALRHD